MTIDSLIVGLAVLAAVGFLVRRIVRARRATRRGCDHCGH